ncbi:tetratricopeptide repeat protein [Nocardiopsis ansamitocini]|uniref:tetratricopeptide repeat protein n=1 Tax=Nocardiopsis ansamitocini TaxID=1670832 RepID=UPI002554C612|nr:tetratricopeptide repeat protein [Nocardiopsis ansamitocini]
MTLTRNGDVRLALSRRTVDALTAAWQSVLRTIGFSAPEPTTFGDSTGVTPAERAARLELALDSAVQTLGTHHPRTIAARNNLASKYAEIGRRTAAIAQFEQAVEDALATLGEEHPETEVIRENLALCYEDAARPSEAAGQWESLVQQRNERMGSHAAETVSARASLASAYRKSGLYDAAIAHFELAIGDSRGVASDELEGMRIGLALALKAIGRLEETCGQFRMVLAQRRRRLGARHHLTLSVHHQLGRAYVAAGREPEALRTLRQTYRDCLAAAGDHEVRLLTMRVRRDLAGVYRTAGLHREAAALF